MSRSGYRRHVRRILIALLVVVAGCAPTSTDVDQGALAASFLSLDELDRLVARWDQASSLQEAQAAASDAHDQAARLLPGRDGEPQGLVLDAVGTDRCARDAHGGSWDDPEARWSEFDAAVEAWSETNNTFPSLVSHPMRVMGWARLTMDAADLDEAHSYAPHAQLHVDITRGALESCGDR